MKHKLLNLDERIAQELRIRIEEGDYAVGQKLPGERIFAQMYHVQRNTIRGALKRLVEMGIIDVNSRRGYTIARPKYVICADYFGDIEEQLPEECVKWENILVREAVLSRDKAERLQLNQGLETVELERCGVIEGVPLCLERWTISGDRLKGRHLSGNEQIYAYMRETGKGPVYSNQTMDICYAGQREAELFKMEALAPLLLIRVYTYDAGGIFFDYHECLFRPERFLFAARETSV